MGKLAWSWMMITHYTQDNIYSKERGCISAKSQAKVSQLDAFIINHEDLLLQVVSQTYMHCFFLLTNNKQSLDFNVSSDKYWNSLLCDDPPSQSHWWSSESLSSCTHIWYWPFNVTRCIKSLFSDFEHASERQHHKPIWAQLPWPVTTTQTP